MQGINKSSRQITRTWKSLFINPCFCLQMHWIVLLVPCWNGQLKIWYKEYPWHIFLDQNDGKKKKEEKKKTLGREKWSYQNSNSPLCAPLEDPSLSSKSHLYVWSIMVLYHYRTYHMWRLYMNTNLTIKIVDHILNTKLWRSKSSWGFWKWRALSRRLTYSLSTMPLRTVSRVSFRGLFIMSEWGGTFFDQEIRLLCLGYCTLSTTLVSVRWIVWTKLCLCLLLLLGLYVSTLLNFFDSCSCLA